MAAAAADDDTQVCYARGLEYGDDHWGVCTNRVVLDTPDPLRVAVLRWQATPAVRVATTSVTATGAKTTGLDAVPAPSDGAAAAGTTHSVDSGGKTDTESTTSDASAPASVPVIVRVNPTDVRGHRLLVTVTDDVDPRRTFNRPASPEEDAALFAALGLMRHCFQRLGLFGQAVVAGNNAHDAVTREGSSATVMVVGKPHEMNLIHGHVLARGPPLCEPLVSGVPLRSPTPGEEFSLRGPKVSSTDATCGSTDCARVANRLRGVLEAIGGRAGTAIACFGLEVQL